MRPGGWRTTLRYRVVRITDCGAYWWACLLAAFEEFTILAGFRPRYVPPPRHGLHVPGRTPWQAARRIAVDPRFVPKAEQRRSR